MAPLLLVAVMITVLIAAAGSTGSGAASSAASLSAVHEQRLAKLSLHLVKLSSTHDRGSAGITRGSQAQAYAPMLKGIFDHIYQLIFDYIFRLEDPLPFPHFNLKFDSTLVRGKLSLTGLQVMHVRELKVQSYSLNIGSMCATFQTILPHFSIHTNYDIVVENAAFPVHRKGKAKLEMQNVNVDTDLCLTLFPLTVKTAHMKVVVTKNKVNVENLFPNQKLNKIINVAATEALPPLVQELQKAITYYIMQYIDKQILDILPFENFP
ncbi:uncharacterized protein LOC113213920 [Frankliniella occidentalis]|uniref:Uncharacterized protein LOC113213920 n=1 Tax=Frankliniella occidentalis TaxID=133901 RepID=A0A6J1TDI7_FRAOC|nr:uncharacterized protein LOC113213920 [Frankliniella occidentalis]XP_052121750.1 uncharacterized protein LOC113213920 [Frankliniella occidentalis]